MDDNFDFQINFQDIADIPLSHIPDTESSQGSDGYIEISQNGKRSYQCTEPECGKIFRFKSEANRHLIIHQKERPHCCSFSGCKKTFKRPETLEDHMRIHEGNLPFPCDEPGCGRKFVSKPALRYHQLRHQNNREYRCEIEGCGKSFLTVSQLKQHQRAAGLHCSKPVSEVPENKPNKLHKGEPVFINVSESELKPLEGIQWGTNTQRQKDVNQDEKMHEKYEIILSILAENRILKERLQQDEKLKAEEKEKEQEKVQEKEAQFDFQFPQFTDSNSFPDVGEPSSFFDSYELKFLEFLKEK